MQVTKSIAPAGPHMPIAQRLSEKQLFDEINYYRAVGLAKKMLEKGLITREECDKILAESRKIFVPVLADLL